MLQAGAPVLRAIEYFTGTDNPSAPDIAYAWLHSHVVRREMKRLEGTSFEEKSSEERWRSALDRHYDQMAYFLYHNNYNDLQGPDKQKADACRLALEAKVAGMAGKGDALTRFFDDLSTGKVKLPGTGVH